MHPRTIALLILLAAACGDSTSGPGSDSGGMDDAGPDDGGPITDGALSDGGAEDAAPPDAGPEPCDTPGETRIVTCGMCGMASERCEGGVWMSASICLNEGECMAADVEVEITPRCGERTRLCDATCTWLPWDTTMPDMGECDSGDERMIEGSCGPTARQRQFCDASCTWVDLGGCESLCGTLRTDPWDALEVCVPAGLFNRGDALSFMSPPREVTLSMYAVDAYLVTNRRYLECRTAGGCTGALGTTEGGEASVSDPARADWPVTDVSYIQAVDYCRWDGGRRLPTEHEWEKAARGPSPRTNRQTWGDEVRCDLMPTGSCPGVDGRTIPYVEPVDLFPDAVSYYGMHNVHGSGPQFVADWWAPGYVSDRDTDVDPQGPSSGEHRVGHGYPRPSGLWAISDRINVDPTRSPGMRFRCARSVMTSE